MTDPVYGDRRCPTCQSVKLNAIDPCWYCDRGKPASSAVEAAEALQRMMPDNFIDALLEAAGPNGQNVRLPRANLDELESFANAVVLLTRLRVLEPVQARTLERFLELAQRAATELRDLRVRVHRIEGWKNMTADEFDAVVHGLLAESR